MSLEEDYAKNRENFALLGGATIRAIADFEALKRASLELLPGDKHAELMRLWKKYLTEKLEKEEISLEDSDAALAAIVSTLREQQHL